MMDAANTIKTAVLIFEWVLMLSFMSFMPILISANSLFSVLIASSL